MGDYVFHDDDGKVKLRVFFDGGDPPLNSITKAVSGAVFLDENNVPMVRLYVAGSNITPASGNAQPGDVAAPKTFTNDSGEQTGTLPDFRGASPQQVPYIGGVPSEVRVQLPTGIFEANNPAEQVFLMDTNYNGDNIRATAQVLGMPGTFTADATATAEDIAAGKTAGINGVMVTGTATPQASVYQYHEAQIQGTWMHPEADTYVMQVQTPDLGIVDLIGMSVRLQNANAATWDFGGTTPLDLSGLTFDGHDNDSAIFTAEPQTLVIDTHQLVGQVENVLVADGGVSFTLKFTVSDDDSITTNDNALVIKLQALTS